MPTYNFKFEARTGTEGVSTVIEDGDLVIRSPDASVRIKAETIEEARKTEPNNLEVQIYDELMAFGVMQRRGGTWVIEVEFEEIDERGNPVPSIDASDE